MYHELVRFFLSSVTSEARLKLGSISTFAHTFQFKFSAMLDIYDICGCQLVFTSKRKVSKKWIALSAECDYHVEWSVKGA